MTYNEIRNVTGIMDDPTLNAACESERKEILAEEIAAKIISYRGFNKGLYNGDVFRFPYVKEVLKNFGFEYVESDDETESHHFANKETGSEIYICPKTYYRKQDAFRFRNFLLF